MKHPAFILGFIAVLGIVLLTIFFAILYQKNFGSGSTFASLLSIPLFTPIFLFCLPGGTVLLTAGIWGIGKQYSKEQRKPICSICYSTNCGLHLLLVHFLVGECACWALESLWRRKDETS